MTSLQPHKSPCQFFPTCGGCDFLDLAEENYRNLKQDFFSELRLPEAEFIWIDPHSRRKVNFQIDIKNSLGFFTKKSKSIAKITNCFVAEKKISDLIPKLQNFLKNQEENLFTQISTTLFDNGLSLIFFIKRALNLSQIQKLTNFAQEENLNIAYSFQNQIFSVFQIRKNQIFYPDFKIDLDPDIFIQATKSGLDKIIEICRNQISQSKKDLKIIDLYSGFGAYSFGICDLASKIKAFEGSKKMTDLINRNANRNDLNSRITAETRDLFFDPISKKELKDFDLAIINPPRNGASPQITEIAKSGLKSLIYVSCNPQSFVNDLHILLKENFKIKKLYVLDQFYATKHLELIAVILKD